MLNDWVFDQVLLCFLLLYHVGNHLHLQILFLDLIFLVLVAYLVVDVVIDYNHVLVVEGVDLEMNLKYFYIHNYIIFVKNYIYVYMYLQHHRQFYFLIGILVVVLVVVHLLLDYLINYHNRYFLRNVVVFFVF